jgi:hypothetical protein
MAVQTTADIRAAMKTVLEEKGKPMHIGDLRDAVIKELGLKVNKKNQEQIGPLVLLLLDGITFKLNADGKIELTE